MTENTGFQAQLRGASLWDLVQMECLSLSHRVVRITTVDDIGYLYFSGGQIIHAKTHQFEGETAALAVLGWEEGSFEVVDRPWPAQETIACAWQSLVMRAAQMRDEGSKGGLANLLVFPKSEPTSQEAFHVGGDEAVNPRAKEVDVKNDPLRVMVQLAPDGTVLNAKGEAAEEFSGMAAYASQLARLVGEGLGLEGFREMECEFKVGRCLIYLDENGNTVAVRPENEFPMSKVREMLGFRNG